VTAEGSASGRDRGLPAGDGDRPITLFSATILVVANMIGTGVFTTLGLQVANIHSAPAILLLWGLGGVMAFCGAVSYGELGAMMPRSGGEYVYLGRIYHPALGFLSGWVSMLAGFAAPAALAAIALGKYVRAIAPGVDEVVLGVAAIVLFSAAHLAGVRLGIAVQNVLTLGKIALIVSFIVAGWLAAAPQPLTSGPGASVLESVLAPSFALSLVYVYYAYSGWNAAAYVAGEVRRPQRTVPAALFLGTLIVSILYVFINFVFLRTVPMRELAGAIDVGFLSARAIFGAAGSQVMTLLVSLALASSLSSMVMLGPRVTQVMGEDVGPLRAFAKRGARGAPTRAIVLQSSVAIILTVTSTFGFVLTYVGFTLSLSAVLAVAGVFVLRVRAPAASRPFRAWGYPFTPAIFVVVNGWMLGQLLANEPRPAILGLCTVAVGLLFYPWLKGRSEGRPSARRGRE
jgi:APA family basic amino acid/polyamine antiporter